MYAWLYTYINSMAAKHLIELNEVENGLNGWYHVNWMETQISALILQIYLKFQLQQEVDLLMCSLQWAL